MARADHLISVNGDIGHLAARGARFDDEAFRLRVEEGAIFDCDIRDTSRGSAQVDAARSFLRIEYNASDGNPAMFNGHDGILGCFDLGSACPCSLNLHVVAPGNQVVPVGPVFQHHGIAAPRFIHA